MKILVAGSKRSISGDARRCQEFEKCAAEVGRAISRNAHTLLLESDDPITFDFHALHGAISHSERTDIEVHRLLSLERIYTGLNAPNIRQFSYGEPPFRLQQEDRRLWARVGAVAAADVVIMMGGATGTETFGSASADLRRPVVAIPAFDGAGGTWFDKCLPCYQSRTELQDLLGAVRSPAGIHDWGDAIIQFAELLARKHAYFLSYAHEDAPAADHIEVLLRRKNRAVFRDEAKLRLGTSFENDIKEQLRRSDTYVGLWSKSFWESDWCRKELNWAIELQRDFRRPRRVHLILLDDSPLEDGLKHVLHAPGVIREDRLASLSRMLEEEIG